MTQVECPFCGTPIGLQPGPSDEPIRCDDCRLELEVTDPAPLDEAAAA